MHGIAVWMFTCVSVVELGTTVMKGGSDYESGMYWTFERFLPKEAKMDEK